MEGTLNSRDFGVVGDGVADDTAAAQRALDQFTTRRVATRSGTLLFSGQHKITAPLYYGGDPSNSIVLRGDNNAARGGTVGTSFNWYGNAATMLVFYGANASKLTGINLSYVSGKLTNLMHLTADNQVNATLNAAVAAGPAQVASPLSMTGITVGTAIGIGAGLTFEVVYATAVTPSTFTADFMFAHSAGEQVGHSAGSSGCSVEKTWCSVPPGPLTAGLLIGNPTNGPTEQVSEVSCDGLHGGGVGNPGGAYSLVRVVGSGNVKNWGFRRVVASGFRIPMAIENASGVIHIHELITGGTTDTDVLCNGANLVLESAETEGGGCLLRGAQGANANAATLIGCSTQGNCPADDYVIKWGGVLHLEANTFFNRRTPTSIPKIQASGPYNPTLLRPAGIVSLGNFFQNAGPNDAVFFDGSNNPLSNFSAYIVGHPQRLLSVGDYGTFGQFLNQVGALSVTSASLGSIPSADGVSPGISFAQRGALTRGLTQITVPYQAFQANALTKDLNLAYVPPGSRVVSAVADVAVPFGGPAGALMLRAGIAAGGQQLLLDADVKTAPTIIGLNDAELGPGLSRAGAVQGGIMLSWTAAGYLTARLTSTSGNLSGLTQGSVTFFVIVDRMK